MVVFSAKKECLPANHEKKFCAFYSLKRFSFSNGNELNIAITHLSYRRPGFAVILLSVVAWNVILCETQVKILNKQPKFGMLLVITFSLGLLGPYYPKSDHNIETTINILKFTQSLL